MSDNFRNASINGPSKSNIFIIRYSSSSYLHFQVQIGKKHPVPRYNNPHEQNAFLLMFPFSQNHYLIAPSTIPAMICFCAKMKMITIGVIVSNAAAKIKFHCTTKDPTKDWIATGRVLTTLLDPRIRDGNR